MATALIVDDNEMNLESLRLLVQQEGMNACTVSLPGNLVEIATEMSDLAVIFLDLEFPNHNGLDLALAIKTHPALAEVPLIAYTVHISEQNEARTAGFDGFLGKPLNIRAFPEQLRRILNGELVWDAGL